MNAILINILNGISYAFLLFLLASGLSLIFGVMGIINLTHGALYMLGAYLGLTVAGSCGSFLLGSIVAALGIGCVGFVVDRAFLKRLHKRLDEQALLTLGLVYIMANVALWVWGPDPQIGTVPSILRASIQVGNMLFPIYRLAIIVIGVIFFAILWWLQNRTRIGAAIRAGMDDKEMTIGLGVNYGAISGAVFVAGAMMGGIAGFIGAPITGVYPDISMDVLLLSMIVVVVGGLGSIEGALLGSLIIGLIDTFGKAYFSNATMFTIYAIFIAMLLIRPTGLLGRRSSG